MEHNQNLLNDIQETIKKINELHNLAYTQYSQAVDEVLAGRITEESQVEHILDGILDFGDDLPDSWICLRSCVATSTISTHNLSVTSCQCIGTLR